jgi:integrase/predicted GIY-YIG superfamily endonuclease
MKTQATISAIKSGLVPFRSGVYVVRDGQGQVLYVGRTENFTQRFITHLRKNSLLEISSYLRDNLPMSLAWEVELWSDDECLISKHETENELISQYRPRFNTQMNTREKMVTTNAIVRSEQPSLLVGVGFDVSILAGQCAASTIAMYRRDFAAYAAFAGGFENASTPATLARWRAHLANVTTMSPNTINRMLSAVKRLMMEGAKQGYLPHEIAEQFKQIDGVKVKALRERKRKHARTRITPNQMRAICSAPDTSTLAGKMHRALLLTLASSGLRIGEAVNLKANQIERRDKGYVITGILGKGAEDEQDALLSKEAYTAIQVWLSARTVDSEYLFTGFTAGRKNIERDTPIRPVSAWELVQRYAAVAGVPHVKPHDFRRFVGTELAKKDIRLAQKVLRHKSITTTAKHYDLSELPEGETDNLF